MEEKHIIIVSTVNVVCCTHEQYSGLLDFLIRDKPAIYIYTTTDSLYRIFYSRMKLPLCEIVKWLPEIHQADFLYFCLIHGVDLENDRIKPC